MPVKVNMAKARVLQLMMIRNVRDAELAALDIPFIRAIEAADTGAQNRIAKEKQTLRDIPQTFDLQTGIRTPAELKAAWPEGLPRG